MLPALFSLAVAAFAIGTTEFAMIGLVPDVARDLAVTIPQALFYSHLQGSREKTLTKKTAAPKERPFV
ncbi:hypothetical protein [Thalassospira australica]|uniref:hypothetical protein n=1 Tax=Thalassospira australica TaxID=1528106 RepID=UPI003850EB26